MTTAREQEIDSLSDLEDRITRTVELVNTLKQEREELLHRLQGVEAERDQARAEAQSASGRLDALGQEIDELRTERKQVRSRIEKLLGQMDLLSA